MAFGTAGTADAPLKTLAACLARAEDLSSKATWPALDAKQSGQS